MGWASSLHGNKKYIQNKRPLGRCRHRYEDNIKIDFKEIDVRM
jgi:hypothetical protein